MSSCAEGTKHPESCPQLCWKKGLLSIPRLKLPDPAHYPSWTRDVWPTPVGVGFQLMWGCLLNPLPSLLAVVESVVASASSWAWMSKGRSLTWIGAKDGVKGVPHLVGRRVMELRFLTSSVLRDHCRSWDLEMRWDAACCQRSGSAHDGDGPSRRCLGLKCQELASPAPRSASLSWLGVQGPLAGRAPNFPPTPPLPR